MHLPGSTGRATWIFLFFASGSYSPAGSSSSSSSSELTSFGDFFLFSTVWWYDGLFAVSISLTKSIPSSFSKSSSEIVEVFKTVWVLFFGWRFWMRFQHGYLQEIFQYFAAKPCVLEHQWKFQFVDKVAPILGWKWRQFQQRNWNRVESVEMQNPFSQKFQCTKDIQLFLRFPKPDFLEDSCFLLNVLITLEECALQFFLICKKKSTKDWTVWTSLRVLLVHCSKRWRKKQKHFHLSCGYRMFAIQDSKMTLQTMITGSISFFSAKLATFQFKIAQKRCNWNSGRHDFQHLWNCSGSQWTTKEET